MSKLEDYIEKNISDYVIEGGYANIKHKDVEEELNILAEDDENFLDEVMNHHIKSREEAQILLTRAIHGDCRAGIRYFAKVKQAMRSYLAYVLDDLGSDGLLEKWQDDYAKEYAEEQRMSEMTYG
tara:strand:+ start:155 stop:529 length:375 start_codon:yes stop_codon:yes gene_type:complete